MTGEDMKSVDIPATVPALPKEWGHFTMPITDTEKWQVLYAQVRNDLDRANAACSAALIEANAWRDRAQKSERALAKIREWLKTVQNEAEAN